MMPPSSRGAAAAEPSRPLCSLLLLEERAQGRRACPSCRGAKCPRGADTRPHRASCLPQASAPPFWQVLKRRCRQLGVPSWPYLRPTSEGAGPRQAALDAQVGTAKGWRTGGARCQSLVGAQVKAEASCWAARGPPAGCAYRSVRCAQQPGAPTRVMPAACRMEWSWRWTTAAAATARQGRRCPRRRAADRPRRPGAAYRRCRRRLGHTSRRPTGKTSHPGRASGAQMTSSACCRPSSRGCRRRCNATLHPHPATRGITTTTSSTRRRRRQAWRLARPCP